MLKDLICNKSSIHTLERDGIIYSLSRIKKNFPLKAQKFAKIKLKKNYLLPLAELWFFPVVLIFLIHSLAENGPSS